jgi:ectoine hydroxylase-related dioxygenase (phytanoyl-CoA dioxygenase family)
MGTDYLIVNIPLGRVTEYNGSTEAWPSTHKKTLSFSEFSVRQGESVRVNTSPGDVVVRYPNLWHRGTPNISPEVRFMLGIIVSRSYNKKSPVTVSEEEQTELLTFGLPAHAEIGSEIKRGFTPNYFKTDFKGNIKELTWLLVPGVFKAIQRIGKLA